MSAVEVREDPELEPGWPQRRTTPLGREVTVWACCLSKIGPECRHRANPDGTYDDLDGLAQWPGVAWYYAEVDSNGVLCVDQLDADITTETQVANLAIGYPRAIYFAVPVRS